MNKYKIKITYELEGSDGVSEFKESLISDFRLSPSRVSGLISGAITDLMEFSGFGNVTIKSVLVERV